MSPASAVLSITEERLYTARLGDRTINGLAVASAWEGLTKYTDRNGAHLIVLDADQRVITASPDLIAQLGAEHHAAGLPQIGAQYAGGYFAGVIDVHGERHALIVAGAEGELTSAWHENTNSITAAESRFDGLANTFAMSRAGSKLAQAAQALQIGGQDDWYIPSRDELDVIYRAFKPTTTRNYADGKDGINPTAVPAVEAHTKNFPVQTTVEGFREGGKDALLAKWYWSSTQYAAFPDDAWGQVSAMAARTTSTSLTPGARVPSADCPFSNSFLLPALSRRHSQTTLEIAMSAVASVAPAAQSSSPTPAVGTLIEGGYFAGQIRVDGVLFGLVMAGAAGELSGRWNGATDDSVTGADSFADGMKNTAAMALSGSKLAQRAMDLSINGFEDWYIPARDELELLYRAFKPSITSNYRGEGINESSVPRGDAYATASPAQTTITALMEDEADALIPAWYWSSTQYAATPNYAWFQNFVNGLQYSNRKSYAGRARAVRRFVIQ